MLGKTSSNDLFNFLDEEEGSIVEKERREHWDSWSHHPQIISLFAQKTLAEVFKKHPSPGTMVEVGCGNSALVEVCLQKNWKIVAVDPSKIALGNLEERIRSVGLDQIAKTNLTYVCESLERYQFPKEVSFIFGQNVFPYAKPEEFLISWDKMQSSLKKGGVIAGNFFVRPIDPKEEKIQRESGGIWFADLPMVRGLLKTGSYKQILAKQKGVGSGTLLCIAEKI